MKARHAAIEAVQKAILADGLADALFLKGSIARGEDDDYSDVDFYAAVSDESREAFLVRRIAYLEAYMPLVYWSESDFVGPQIVGVFENGLHFDLYTVPADAVPQTEDIRVLCDAKGILASYRKQPLAVPQEALPQDFNEFTFTLLEFRAAYLRGDTLWAIRLVDHEVTRVAIWLRFLHDREESRLALRRLGGKIPQADYGRLLAIHALKTPEGILACMQAVVALRDDVYAKMPEPVRRNVNEPFYTLARGMVMQIAK